MIILSPTALLNSFHLHYFKTNIKHKIIKHWNKQQEACFQGRKKSLGILNL